MTASVGEQLVEPSVRDVEDVKRELGEVFADVAASIAERQARERREVS
jgi:hypothetical protein